MINLFVLTLLPLIAPAVDLSCRGYTYNGIVWDDVRSTLEIYADKYMDRPQLLMDTLQLAQSYGLEYHPENECILGDLSLRFLLWLRLDDETLRSSVRALSARAPETPAEQIVHETYGMFWDLRLSWREVLDSGWPIFSIIAAAASKVVDPAQDACVSDERLRLYTETFDNAIYVPGHADLATLAEAPGCPDAVAAALLSLADGYRTSTDETMNRYYRFTAAPKSSQPAEQDVDILLERVETLLRKQRGWSLLSTRWPVWRLLDRLAAYDAVNVSSGTNSFWMYVFPHRVRSDGLISNRIRATQRAYCLELFQTEVLRLARDPARSSSGRSGRPLRLVEAGPHIGDCMLWASAELGNQVRGLAVEPVPQVVSLFRRSVAANNFDIELHHGFAGSRSSPPLPGHSVPWVSLDDLLAEDIDVLKIHTNGGERGILDGAANLFSRHKVEVVIVHSAEQDELWKSALFLLERGYRVVVDGRRDLTARDGAWLKAEVAARGGLQLHALHQR
eukprot:TRINITY_DN25229_c1_g1_i1.p1 TRINITY_DN25229_c1_g1~~TRINITY_DN25229_c1_g1_i1.p1  ORF type:complete len:526 (+),score=100.53 TRINITY_DN25229_c1_g1_i1:62-1579(+)